MVGPRPQLSFSEKLNHAAAPIGGTTSAACCLSFSFFSKSLCASVRVQMGKGGKVVSHLSQIMLPEGGYQTLGVYLPD